MGHRSGDRTGFAPNTAFTTIGSPGATGRLTVTLHKGFAVSGRVLDEGGKPIAKARVTATNGAWTDWTESDLEHDGATTNDKGQFTIPALAAGTGSLLAVDGEHAPGKSAPVTIADHAATSRPRTASSCSTGSSRAVRRA